MQALTRLTGGNASLTTPGACEQCGQSKFIRSN